MTELLREIVVLDDVLNAHVVELGVFGGDIRIVAVAITIGWMWAALTAAALRR